MIEQTGILKGLKNDKAVPLDKEQTNTDIIIIPNSKVIFQTIIVDKYTKCIPKTIETIMSKKMQDLLPF